MITGPSETTETLENTVTSSGSSSGSDPSPPPELNEAGTGVTIGGLAASNVGTYPNDGAMHQGTTPGNLDTSQGLASAVGGELMHPIGFDGAEIQPTDSGSGILLDEPESPHGSSTPWQSHPLTVGYSRPWGDGNTVNGGTSNANGTSPGQDSGTSNGSTQDETARLSNLNGGAAQNATSTQAAPTARAQQKAAVAANGGSSRSGASSGSGGGGNGAPSGSVYGAGGVTGSGSGGYHAGGQQMSWLPYIFSDELWGPPGSIPNGAPGQALSPQAASKLSVGGLCAPGVGVLSSQANPGGAAPATTNDNSLTFQDLANNPGTFFSNLASGFGKALVGTVVIGGFLMLAGAAGPVAGGVALAAGVILLGVGIYSWYQQGSAISTGMDASGTPISKQDRVAMTGDLLGQIFGAFLGGKALKGFGDFLNPKTEPGGQVETPTAEPASTEPAAPEPAPGECSGESCFPAGTLVATADGPKAIERIPGERTGLGLRRRDRHLAALSGDRAVESLPCG